MTNPSAGALILSIGCFLCIGGVLHLVFVPKFLMILMGVEVTLGEFMDRKKPAVSADISLQLHKSNDLTEKLTGVGGDSEG